jgi:hypothetical protein
MTDDSLKRILESNAKQNEEYRKFHEEQRLAFEQLKKDGDERAEAYGHLAIFLKKNLGETNAKLEIVAKKQDVATKKLDPESEDYILKEFQPMLKSYNDANTIVSFFQHGVVKTLLVVGSLGAAFITIRELFFPNK